ncbi:hypothetical protein CKY10_09465 [Photorhabdus sp. HUG-39]|nr:hypothetical protein CKY10_09465 [Photorhabdus sp. HUG-39]
MEIKKVKTGYIHVLINDQNDDYGEQNCKWFNYEQPLSIKQPENSQSRAHILAKCVPFPIMVETDWL